MKKRTFFIAGEFPSLNEYIAAERGHRQAAAQMKRDFTSVAQYAVTGEEPVDLRPPMSVTFVWYRKNALTDLDNVSFGQKFVLDGMVKAGIIRDDNMNMITKLTHECMVRPQETGVLVSFVSDLPHLRK